MLMELCTRAADRNKTRAMVTRAAKEQHKGGDWQLLPHCKWRRQWQMGENLMEMTEIKYLIVVDQRWGCQQQLPLSGTMVVTAEKWLLGVLSKVTINWLVCYSNRVIKFIRRQQSSHCLFQCHGIAGIVQHGRQWQVATKAAGQKLATINRVVGCSNWKFFNLRQQAVGYLL